MKGEEQRKVAYVFPPEGSQKAGMGSDLYVRYSSARKVFDEVDTVLGFSLSRLCFEGPEEQLKEPINAQLAVVTTSIACLKACQQDSGKALPPPSFVAGHSVGESAALVVAGVLGLSDAIRLVHERARLLNEAGRRRPGGMLAIVGLQEETIKDICASVGTEVSIAIINSPHQIVISGAEDSLAEAGRLGQIKGARRIIPLRVSYACHSPLMEPASKGLKSIIPEFAFRKPSVPIVANLTAQALTDVEAIKEELINQILYCVQWQQSVEYMIARGITTFFEIGPGGVLTELIHQINPAVQTFHISNAPSVREVIERWKR